MPKINERTNRIQVRLSDSMFERLKVVAEDMGIPYSTLGTVAVSEFVIRKEREHAVVNSSVDAAKEVFREYMPFIRGEDVDAEAEKALNQLMNK